MKLVAATAFLSAVLCAVCGSSAQAALLSLDHPIFGIDSITRDTATGLDWLDVPTFQGRAFPDVVTFFDVAEDVDASGELSGFRHATITEFQSLALNAGIPNTNVTVTGDLTPFTDLIDLVGATSLQAGNPQTSGFLIDVTASGLRRKGDLEFFFSDGIPAYSANTNAALIESVAFLSTGHWLVRPAADSQAVPEPLSLLGVATVCGFIMATKRQPRHP